MRLNLLNQSRYAESERQFAIACFYSRAHCQLAQFAMETFGDHGALISGCVRDHFPAEIKDTLRALARAVTVHSERAYAARPKGARFETIRKLGQAVATRDGSGRYGPQPARAA